MNYVYLVALSIAPLAAVARVEAAPVDTALRPNIVYIMADELGYYELSHMGHPMIQTPSIDRMAVEGLRFTQALAGSSLCAPTRCTLMTGKHSGHSSVRTNGGGTPLRADEVTIASVLEQTGYATGGYGKWGCGGRGSTGVPEKHGFDEFLGYYDQVHAHSYYPPYLVRNSEEFPLEGNVGGRSGETYSHYRIFDAALQFIRRNKDRPFFCYLPVTPPHGLFDIPDEDPAWKTYQNRDWPEAAKRYAAMVTMLDRQVGELLALLAELGLDRKTIVFFCGDNGGNDYFRSKERPRGFHAPNVDPRTGIEFRGQKGKLYEGGLRIPMLVRWPGKIAAGRVSSHLWYFPDVFPTLAELGGAEQPDGIDGISIVPELLGAETAGRVQELHQFLYWELGQQRAVREGSWKAVQPRKDAPWELYDLSRDVSETRDLAEMQPAIVERLVSYAEAAHTPERPGRFLDTEAHEKDRWAKWGTAQRPAPRRRGQTGNQKVRRIPTEGAISNEHWRVLRVSSESRVNAKLAAKAIDGDPGSHWHTRWQNELAKHPHEIVIDLGTERQVRGIRYLARQDAGWNGAFRECEVFVSDSREVFGEPCARPTFGKVKDAQEVLFAPREGRYLKIRVLSEVGGGPWASMAELGVVGR